MSKTPCLYCGYPTPHPSKTCPAHRDLARPVAGLDAPYDKPVKSSADGSR